MVSQRSRRSRTSRLIEVDADSAQYWDSTDSTMRYLWEVATANLTGREPDMGKSARIDLKPNAAA